MDVKNSSFLDGVFRQRINTEIENFRACMNEIVTDQQMNFQTMFNLQQDAAQEVPEFVKLYTFKQLYILNYTARYLLSSSAWVFLASFVNTVIHSSSFLIIFDFRA